ncbi:hypothetical protein TBR22_A21770 [Luteitalea sp. TBR-22]|uniref:hypothetical protein n=1 Tax=Luteitalea sp. TBR-22 TaxID=2802971 RepID=UPI001AFC6780|nr:hypothetical protein [Luteitalea sp. TBR-22]BCS32953.1 hypothetical protein TBR22_A21770 [Luteitalea sp. TBR-22]
MRVRLASLGLVAVLGIAHLGAQPPASLAGTWRYNAEASDVGGTGDGADDSGPMTLGGFGTAGRAPLGGYGSTGVMTPMTPEARKQRADLVRELVQPSRRLTITQDAASISFTFDDGRTVKYRTDGKPEKHQAVNGVVETETRWKKGRLVRETHLDDGLSIEETFTLVSPRGLVIETEVLGGIGRRKPVRRVYDPVEDTP